MFASIGLLLSFNLGRSYLSLTKQNEEKKRELLTTFVALNLMAMALTAFLAFLFWYFSSAARNILDLPTLLALIASSTFYVWSINGNAFFASLQKTHRQELVILLTRAVLILFILLFYFLSAHDLTLFLCFYSLILCLGVFVEIFILRNNVERLFVMPTLKNMKLVLFESIWPHLDFLGFNLFPLVLILIAGHYLEKAQIGRINFTIQMINFIFLLSVTANIRVSSYVSVVGFDSRIPQLKKLFWATLGVSMGLSIAVFFLLQFIATTSYFNSFAGTASFFALTGLAIPGYLAYQILNPLWLEKRMIRQSAIFSLLNALAFTGLAFVVLPLYHEWGAVGLFAAFYLSLFGLQGVMFVRNAQTK